MDRKGVDIHNEVVCQSDLLSFLIRFEGPLRNTIPAATGVIALYDKVRVMLVMKWKE